MAGSWGRVRLPTPSRQLSLPITGSIQACFHPQGFVLPSGPEFRSALRLASAFQQLCTLRKILHVTSMPSQSCPSLSWPWGP